MAAIYDAETILSGKLIFYSSFLHWLTQLAPRFLLLLLLLYSTYSTFYFTYFFPLFFPLSFPFHQDSSTHLSVVGSYGETHNGIGIGGGGGRQQQHQQQQLQLLTDHEQGKLVSAVATANYTTAMNAAFAAFMQPGGSFDAESMHHHHHQQLHFANGNNQSIAELMDSGSAETFAAALGPPSFILGPATTSTDLTVLTEGSSSQQATSASSQTPSPSGAAYFVTVCDMLGGPTAAELSHQGSTSSATSSSLFPSSLQKGAFYFE